MKKNFAFIAFLLMLNFYSKAQSFAINTTGTAAHASAMLDVTSTTKGLLIPRLTTAQRTAIASPGKGLLVYDSTLKSFYFHDGVNWQQINADSNNLWRKNGNVIYNSNTGNVGIGTTTAQSLLQVKTGAVLFDSTIGGTPVNGAGTRFMWIPAKAALRAGIVSSTNWDDINIGSYSIGLGYNTKATGNYSVAIGTGAYALADQAISIGSSTAAAYRSTAFGAGGTASATDAVVMGYGCISAGISSFATGNYSGAYGAHSFAIGDTAYAIGDNSVAMGNKSRANSISSIAMGDSAVTGGNVAFATGYHTNAGGNYSTAMGYVTNASGPNSTALGSGTTASGFYSTAIGNGSIASGGNSTAMGFGTIASNNYSTSMSYLTTASGSYSVAMGWITKASGDYSTAMGSATLANGYSSTTLGAATVASGYYSTAMGLYTKSKFYGGLVIGTFNDSTNAPLPSSLNPLDRIFQIGNGISDFARSNAMTVLQNGNIGIGELNPTSPLNFASTLGDKIALWGNGSNHYGLGIQPSLLQVYSDGGGSDIAFGYGNSAAMTENVRFKGNGNVGIGTNSPAYMLTVKKDIDVDNEDGNAGTITNALKFGGTGTGEAIGSNRTNATNRWGLDFYTNFTNRMSITTTGNVGVGTTSPTSALDVNGQITIDQKNFGGYAGLLIKGNTAVSNYPNIGFSTQNTAATDIIAAVIGGNITNNTAGSEAIDLGFYTSTTGQGGLTQRMVIKDNGNVGVGNTAPTAKLDVTGTTTTDGLQVSNGTVFTKMQSGTILVGNNGTSQKTITIIFTVPFVSATPKVFFTARSEPASSYTDAFSVSIRSITAATVTVNIQRTDSNAGWGQALLLDWFAVE